MIRCFCVFVTLLRCLLLSEALATQQPPDSPYPSKYPPDVVEKRVATLLKQLTLHEKIGLLAGDSFDGMSTVAIPRLGIPKLVMADGPQGIRAHGPACSFPSGIALAATWDTKLAFDYGAALGREARARDIQIQLGPGVNIARTPLNGRNFEYFGEDPYLTGEMAAEWIRGLQSQWVVATVKHFVGNDTEWRRMEIETLMSEQTLREIYLQPFQKALEKGGAWSVMSAYNKVNGFPSTSNDILQNSVLKKEWKFPGLVMSDWWATDSVDAIGKGLDLEMPMGYRVNQESVTKALQKGSLQEEQIDQAVGRLLRMALSMGFLDKKPQIITLPQESKENSDIALDVATKSIVLLKNQSSLLPLDKKHLKRVIVYGPNAQDTPAVGGGSGGVIPFHRVSFLEGIRQALPKETDVFFAPMPLNPHVSLFNFFELNNPTTPLPRITNIRRMVSVTETNFTKVTSSKQRNIQITWGPKNRPEEIPKDKEARITWDAEIMIPEAGNYELIAEGHPEIRLGDRELGNPDSYVMTLEKESMIPLRVTASEVGRGRGQVSLKIQPVADKDSGILPAKEADVAIICVGLNPLVEGEGYDRGFALPIKQQELIKQVSAVNPHTIVVLSGGAAVEMNSWIGKVPAVLQTWYLGQSAGTALASILFGKENPSGHLPCTFDRSIEENPSFKHYPGSFPEGKEWPVADYHEGIFYGYRGYDRSAREPLFPFGYGLSYTSFTLSGMTISAVGKGYEIKVEVTNIGKLNGATVVQLYLGLSEESTPRPLRELKGFQRVELKAGERRTIVMTLTQDSMMYWHPLENHWVKPTGSMKLELGFSEREILQEQIMAPLVFKNAQEILLPPPASE